LKHLWIFIPTTEVVGYPNRRWAAPIADMSRPFRAELFFVTEEIRESTGIQKDINLPGLSIVNPEYPLD
jgi:hypothetical protein